MNVIHTFWAILIIKCALSITNLDNGIALDSKKPRFHEFTSNSGHLFLRTEIINESSKDSNSRNSVETSVKSAYYVKRTEPTQTSEVANCEWAIRENLPFISVFQNTFTWFYIIIVYCVIWLINWLIPGLLIPGP